MREKSIFRRLDFVYLRRSDRDRVYRASDERHGNAPLANAVNGFVEVDTGRKRESKTHLVQIYSKNYGGLRGFIADSR
jgi:hypothetical protein